MYAIQSLEECVSDRTKLDVWVEYYNESGLPQMSQYLNCPTILYNDLTSNLEAAHSFLVVLLYFTTVTVTYGVGYCIKY